jgi:hypothetical protein
MTCQTNECEYKPTLDRQLITERTPEETRYGRLLAEIEEYEHAGEKPSKVEKQQDKKNETMKNVTEKRTTTPTTSTYELLALRPTPEPNCGKPIDKKYRPCYQCHKREVKQ